MTPKIVHAYSVDPSKDRTNPITKGGPVEINADLKYIFSKNVNAAKFDNKISIDFSFDSERYNEIRTLIMNFVFGDETEKQSSSKFLAEKLSLAMDGRSKPALFLIVQHEIAGLGSASLWLFPSDEAFRLTTDTTDLGLSVVKNIFSNTSYLRKAALFEGQNIRTHFLSGKALDFQSMSSDADVAKLWVQKFLQCKLSVTSESGNRILAQALKKLAVDTTDNFLQSKITAAAISITNSPMDNVSFQHIHDNFIPKELQSRFTRAIGPQNMPLSFKKDEGLLSNFLGRNVYSLDTGVSVITPLTEIGESVIIDLDKDRKLTCTGSIRNEKLRGQYVKQ